MLVRFYSDAYAITPGPDDLTAGTVGVWFTAAGTVTAVTQGGKTITIGGVVGSEFFVPLKKVTAAAGGAAVLGLIGA